MKKIGRFIKYFLYLIIITILLLEIILRFYNPFPNRIKNGRIYLSANRTLYQKNKDHIHGLDDEIKTQFNSLGFRGPEKPANYDSALTIFTVGGSTTFCLYISEGKTWPDILLKNLSADFNKIWLNNAGINGHSSFGHQILLEDYIIPQKPRLVLFMTGINDMGRDKPGDESFQLKDGGSNSLREFLTKKSEVYNLVMTINGALKVKEFGIPLPNINLNNGKPDSIRISQAQIEASIKADSDFVILYGQRMKKLAETCLKNNILPVFITQPILAGKAIDDVTAVNLETIKIGSENSGLIALKLDRYNKELMRVATELDIPAIDLAASMPKSSKYYFDLMHFTNEGTQKVAELLTPPLHTILNNQFHGFEIKRGHY